MNLQDEAEDAMTPTQMKVLPDGGMTLMAAAVQNPEEDTTQMLLLHGNVKTLTLTHPRHENVSKMSPTVTHRHHGEQEEVQTPTYLQLEEEATVDPILTCPHLG